MVSFLHLIEQKKENGISTGISKLNIPDFAGLLWSSIAFSKKRFRSDTDFGTLAEAGGDCRRTQVDNIEHKYTNRTSGFSTIDTTPWNKNIRRKKSTKHKLNMNMRFFVVVFGWKFYSWLAHSS